MFIDRIQKDILSKRLKESNKINILYGARQVGKTTIVKQICSEMGEKALFINADTLKYVDILSSRDPQKMRSLFSGHELIIIDEAQKIPDIGINLKIIADEMKDTRVIATGSSSFDLANKTSEPLTGRSWTNILYPLAFCELKKGRTDFELNDLLENFFVFGGYPEVFTTEGFKRKAALLEEICSSYLYRDVLELSSIRHASKIRDLLKLLAFQIGSEVSINELARNLGFSTSTVDHYIDLLEKSFVVFRLGGFSRNLRKEVSKMDKIYFYDPGIRNAIIDNFKLPSDRNDMGELWENFLISERQKLLSYNSVFASAYFWRTSTGAELDYIEERDGKLSGYEFKYGLGRLRTPKSWQENYPQSSYQLVTRENYLDFVTKP